MKHIVRITDEQYAKLMEYAEENEETPETLFRAWVDGIVDCMEMGRSVRRKRANHKEDEVDEELLSKHPILRLAGIVSSEEPVLTDNKHIDEYLAEAYLDTHAENK